jgi:hypothetical protein
LLCGPFASLTMSHVLKATAAAIAINPTGRGRGRRKAHNATLFTQLTLTPAASARLS